MNRLFLFLLHRGLFLAQFIPRLLYTGAEDNIEQTSGSVDAGWNEEDRLPLTQITLRIIITKQNFVNINCPNKYINSVTQHSYRRGNN